MPDQDARILQFLMNALWQVPAMALAAWLIERSALRRCCPQARYLFWLATLLLVALLPWWETSQPAYRIWRNEPTAHHRSESAPSPVGQTPWWTCAFSAYLLGMAGRLAWRCARLRGLTEQTAEAPLTFGRRVIIPEYFRREASAEALRAALAHEQAHVARGDFALNLAVEIVCLPLAFHPACHWMRRRWGLAREQACDERAAQEFASPWEYACGLAAAAERVASRSPGTAMALGLLDSNGFEERIAMLTTSNRWFSAPVARGAMGLAFACILGCGSMAVAWAVDVEDPQEVARGDDPEVTLPKLTHRQEAKYTDEARNARVSGTVILKLVVNERGVPEKIRVVRALEPSLDRAAQEALAAWRFEPGKKRGNAVAVAAQVEILFQLDN